MASSLRNFLTEKNAIVFVAFVGLVMFLLHIYVAFVQTDYSFVDDKTYVSSAIHLVLGIQCPPMPDNICNYEHPPLAKLLMAAGFGIFGRTQVIGQLVSYGINQLGGRFFQIAMNFLAAPVLYLVIKKISGNYKMALLASILLLIDPLYFTLSSTASLDNAMVFFALLALLPLAYVRELGSLTTSLLAGALFGLSLLSKESAIFIILAVFAYLVIVPSVSWKTKIFSSCLLAAVAVIVFVVGLQLFDSEFTSYPNFVFHLQSILSFQLGVGGGQNSWLSSITNCDVYRGLCPNNRSLVPHVAYSELPLFPILSTNCVACWSSTNPIDWLTYFPPIIFPTDLILATNYPLVWLSFVWVPLAGWSFRKLRSSGEGRALLLGFFLFAGNVISNVLIYTALNRAVFEWYFLPAVPALAIGASFLLTRPKIPKWISYVVLFILVLSAVILSSVTLHLLFPQTQSCGEC